MRTQRRGRITVATVLLPTVVVEALALRAHTLGIVVIAVLAGLGAVVVAAGADLARVGIGAALLSAFTLTWNGWYVGPVRPGDVLVLVALICFAAGAPITVFRSPPWWIRQLVVALILGLFLFVLFPPEYYYLVHRTTVDAQGRAVIESTKKLGIRNLGVAAKFIVAVAFIPIAYTAAALLDRRCVRWLAIATAAGSALSGWVAFVDHEHIASIGQLLTHIPQGNVQRSLGFSYHPNFLAAGLVLAIPFATWLLTSFRGREQVLGAWCLFGDLLGVYASGSRGGAVCAVGAVVLSFIALPRTRQYLPGILLGGGVGVAIVAVIFPSFGLEILRATRLINNPTAAGSDQVRSMLATQGVADFKHSPIHGIGLQVSTDASEVYLQELASGGLILFVAMSIYMLGAAWNSFKLIRFDPLAAAILGAVGATLALNLFEADLTDRFYYVPEAILVAMMICRRADRAVPPDPVPETAVGIREPAEAV